MGQEHIGKTRRIINSDKIRNALTALRLKARFLRRVKRSTMMRDFARQSKIKMKINPEVKQCN